MKRIKLKPRRINEINKNLVIEIEVWEENDKKWEGVMTHPNAYQILMDWDKRQWKEVDEQSN